MALSFIAAANKLAISASSVVVAKPTGTADGDIVFAFLVVNNGSSVTITPPSGFTVIESTTFTNPLIMAVAWKKAASEPTTYTWTVSASVVVLEVITSTFRGQSNVVPIADHQHTIQTSSSTTLASPSVTTAAADSLWLSWVVFNNGTSVVQPSGWTVLDDNPDTVGMGHADISVASAGATGASPTWSASGAGQPNIVVSVALSPTLTGTGALAIGPTNSTTAREKFTSTATAALAATDGGAGKQIFAGSGSTTIGSTSAIAGKEVFSASGSGAMSSTSTSAGKEVFRASGSGATVGTVLGSNGGGLVKGLGALALALTSYGIGFAPDRAVASIPKGSILVL